MTRNESRLDCSSLKGRGFLGMMRCWRRWCYQFQSRIGVVLLALVGVTSHPGLIFLEP